MLVRARSDTNGQVHNLPIAPVHTLGELQQTHACGVHQVAGLRRTVGDGDALAKERGTLRLAVLQPLQVALGDQSVGDQAVRQQAQCVRLVGGRLAHGYLLLGELEHDLLPLQFPDGYWSIVVKFTEMASSTALHSGQQMQKIRRLKRLI